MSAVESYSGRDGHNGYTRLLHLKAVKSVGICCILTGSLHNKHFEKRKSILNHLYEREEEELELQNAPSI